MYRIIVRWHCVAPIIVSGLLAVACATPDSKPPSSSASGSGIMQPLSTPVAMQETARPAAGSAIGETAVAPKPSSAAKPDTYLVQPGDTLALIARRPEIYGDSAMWMMLYRANAGRIPSMDWICPGQILAVPRAYTEADARAAQQDALQRAPWPTGATAKGSYPCKAPPARAAARGTASTATKGGTGAVASDSEATGRSATAAGGGASVAEARSAPVPVPSTASPVTVGTSRDAYRDAARRAYNLRDIPWAIHYYRQHLAKVPRDRDALGELGNLCYQTGNLPVAAGLFYDAARLLLDQGKRDAASRLLLAISEGDPALANDLYTRLSAPAKR